MRHRQRMSWKRFALDRLEDRTTPSAAFSWIPAAAAALPPLAGNVVRVSSAAALQDAIASIPSNTTVLIEPGVYQLGRTLVVRGGVSNISIRGATGNRDDVVIVGKGMNSTDFSVLDGFMVLDAQDVTIADLSVGDVQFHPISVHAQWGCERVLVHNVRLFDAGEQFLKGNPAADGDGVDDSIVENCVFEYTTKGPADGYTNAIDIFGGENWVIRDNLFFNLRQYDGDFYYGPAILMWQKSRNTLVERNLFIDCDRAIAFGLGDYPDAFEHSGGVIRNNFIYNSPSAVYADVAISVFDSPGTLVEHNTIYQSNGYPNAIEYRFPDATGVVIRNNLTNRRIEAREGASATLSGNFLGATAAMFRDLEGGDLHLTAAAQAAIDKVAAPPGSFDFDGEPRPAGSLADVGADEFVPASIAAPTVGVVGPDRVVAGQPVEYRLFASDADGPAGFSFSFRIDWDGDGVFEQAVQAPSGTIVSRVFTDTGRPRVRVQSVDASGNASGVATLPVIVSELLVLPDRENPQLFQLLWGGTSGDDAASFEQIDPTTVRVRVTKRDGAAVMEERTIEGIRGRVVAYGGAGNDVLSAAGLVETGAVLVGGSGMDFLMGGAAADFLFGDAGGLASASGFSLVGGDGGEGDADVLDGGAGDDVFFGDGPEGGADGADFIFGGAGDDRIHADGAEGAADSIQGNDGNDWIATGGGNDVADGGAGADFLDGGDGAEGDSDVLAGGLGNDVLLGNVGQDRLDGGAGEDLLVAGRATLDDQAWAGIRAEWASPRDFQTRIANLTGQGTGPRENGEDFLVPAVAVLDDAVVDQLFGGAGRDWFLASPSQDLRLDLEIGVDVTTAV